VLILLKKLYKYAYLFFIMGKGLVIGIIVIVVLALLLILAFSGGDTSADTDDNDSGDDLGDSDGSSGGDDDTGGTDAPQTHMVEMSSSGFSPSSLTVGIGDIVVFTAIDGSNRWPASALHPTHAVYPESTGTCAVIGGSDFDACGGIANGDSWPFTFNEVGSWGYHDHLSPGTTGSITVVG
jgi:plastocyanin